LRQIEQNQAEDERDYYNDDRIQHDVMGRQWRLALAFHNMTPDQQVTDTFSTNQEKQQFHWPDQQGQIPEEQSYRAVRDDLKVQQAFPDTLTGKAFTSIEAHGKKRSDHQANLNREQFTHSETHAENTAIDKKCK
jgi:small-conductance mechanosensitive channel